MYFERVKTPGLGHNAYVLGCGEGLAVVVDPRRDVDDYLRLARENDLSIAYVLETHRQEDFEFGSRTLAQMTGVTQTAVAASVRVQAQDSSTIQSFAGSVGVGSSAGGGSAAVSPSVWKPTSSRTTCSIDKPATPATPGCRPMPTSWASALAS